MPESGRLPEDECPVDLERADTEPRSQLEQERELMMTERADDLFFGKEPAVPGRIWLLVIVAVLLALAIPLFYAVIGLGGAAVSSTGIVAFIAAAAAIILALAAGGIYVWRRAERSRIRRDDVGNRILSGDEGESSMKVKEFMKANPVVCGVLDSIYDCAKDMYDHNVGFLAVIDENDICVGVVSDRDLVCGGIAQGSDMTSTPVTTIMERNFKSLSPNSSLEDCIKLMQNEGIRRVPVVVNGTIVGLVSIDDLIMEGRCSLEDVAIVLRRQFSEPNPEHGLAEKKSHENRAA